jgi:hypothetical protein
MSGRLELRIGIIGYGAMGKAHTYAYQAAPIMDDLSVTPRVVVISGRDETAVADAAAKYGIPEWTTDWREIVARDDIDVIDICTPPGTHAEIAAAAATSGKSVICEKPLATSLSDAICAADAVEQAGVHNAVGFNYRCLPAVALMQRMISEGAVGEVLLWRAIWLTDEFADARIPFDWRFEKSMGASTIADLGSHLIDMALWMAGPIESVSAQSSTFTTERTSPEGPRQVTCDESTQAMLRFTSGARGLLEVGRVAIRRPCDFFIEVNGTRGTLVFDYSQLNELKYGSVDDEPSLYGMRTIRAEHPTHPYSANWWAIGQGVGYGTSFVNQIGNLLRDWPNAKWEPSFAQGVKVQAVCDAIERSSTSDAWVAIDQAHR